MCGSLQKHFLFEKNFLKSIVAIALPIALQNIISFGVNLMDSVMLGQLGDTAVTAASLGGQPFFLLTMFGFGIASGGSVIIAQYWGKGDMGRIRQVMAMSMRAVFLISVLFTAVCLAAPVPIMQLFNRDPDVVENSVAYLQLLSLSYVFFGLSNCYMMSLRAVEQVKVSTVVYACSFLINVFFNWCFIFGKLGMPALGVRGAAVGTVLARASELIFCLFYMYFIEKRVGFRLKHLFSSTEKLLRKDFARHSLPVVGNELLWGLGTVLMTMIISNISKTFAAANSIASVINQVCSVAAFGVGNAAAVLTGKVIGSGHSERAHRTANTLLLFAFGVGVFGGLLLFFLRHAILKIYDISPAAQTLTDQIIIVLACLQPALAIELTSIVGVLRGGGDTRFAFFIDCGCLWLISLPLGVLSGFVWKLAPAVIFILMRMDTIVKSTVSLIRIHSDCWIRNITR